MMPEHIEPPQSPYPEDVSASAMFASCDHLWMPRLLRDRISPVPQKKSRSFERCSPMFGDNGPNKMVLSQSPPDNRCFVHLFSNRCNPTPLYGSEYNAVTPQKIHSPSPQQSRGLVTTNQIDYGQCSEEQNHGAAGEGTNGALSHKMKVRNKILMMNNASPAAGNSQKTAIFQEPQRMSSQPLRQQLKIEAEEEEEEDQDEGKQAGHGKTKGLKTLSFEVKDIVYSRKKTTYKQVAQDLINSLQFKGVISANSKDEQNVKRRVYDALNVLIASKILRKEGKIVMIETNENQPKKPEFSIQKDRLKQEIQEKQKKIAVKMTKARLANAKYEALKAMMARNKARPASPNERINFPLIGIPFNTLSEQNKVEISDNRVMFSSTKEFQVITETDLLAMLYWKGSLNEYKQAS